MMAPTEMGEIITFYSYKGGTGRSMALSNVACLLAERQSEKNGVLVIDWDLEAPGLHRFFYDKFQSEFASVEDPSRALDEHPGLMDLFLELEAETPPNGYASNEEAEEMADTILRNVQLDRFIVQTDIPGLSLLKAGSFGEQYSQRVNTFDWEDLYNRSPWLINAFAERLIEQFRYVLVDSRTGHTDISGICTMLMPQKLVVVFTPNNQSLTGLLELIRRATRYRRGSDDLRPLLVFPLPSRIEASREDLRTDWRLGNTELNIDGYQPLFKAIFEEVYDLKECDLDHYFDEVQIQQSPDYAYGEEIAVLTEQNPDRFSMATSYYTFVEWLITSTAPWSPPVSPSEDIAQREPDSEPDRVVKVFISYAREDFETARRFYDDLQKPGIEPRLDASKLQPGEAWAEEVIEREIKGSEYFLALVSDNSLDEGGFVQNEWDLALEENKMFIPVRLEERAPPQEMDQLQWVDLFPSYEEGLKKILRFLYGQQSRANFRETFSSIGPDNEGWDLSEWDLNSADHTGRGSESIYTEASLSSSRLLPQTVTKTASIPLALSDSTALQYHRRLDLSVFLGTASFRVIIDDGAEHVIDEESHTGNYAENSWTKKSMDLSRYGGQNVTLKFVVAVASSMNSSSMNYMSRATAWVDDIEILAQYERKEEPPTVEVSNLTGQALSRARSELANAGLELGVNDEAPSETVVKGGIIGQSPAAGKKTERGSLVSVTVSSGPEKKAPRWAIVGVPLAALAFIGLIVWSLGNEPSQQGSTNSGGASGGQQEEAPKNSEIANFTPTESPAKDSSAVYSVAFSPDGRLLASGSVEGTVKLRNPQTGEELPTFTGQHSSYVSEVAFSPPNGRFLASASNDNSVKLWEDPQSGEAPRNLGEDSDDEDSDDEHKATVFGVAFSPPDGRLLASSSFDGTIKLWNPQTRKLLQTLGPTLSPSSDPVPVRSVAFSPPDGRLLAGGMADGTVKLWDLQSGEELPPLPALPQDGHSGPVNSVAFSPDGSRLASGSFDNTVKLWDPQSGELLDTLEGHSDDVRFVAFSPPDGRLLASGSSDGSVRLWDLQSGERRELSRDPDYTVFSVAFSPDGSLLASGSGDGTVKIWEKDGG